MSRNKLVLLGALCALSLNVACGGGAKPEASAPAASEPAAAAAVDTANAGNVTGTVTYTGPDTDTPIAMNADAVCAGLHKEPVDTGEIVVKDGKLANVFVYVKTGMEGKSFPAPADKKEIDQQGCLYHPRIQGIMVGQTLVIKNSDATLHNIHALPTKNTEFNQAQPIQNMKSERTFDKPEVMVHFKCDVHPWMTSYVGVMENPYFAVSGEDGTFAIDKLPPGTYTLEAWHEKLGTAEQQVTIAPNQTATVAFDFKPKP